MERVVLALIGSIVGIISANWAVDNNKSIWYVFIPIGIWAVVSISVVLLIKALF